MPLSPGFFRLTNGSQIYETYFDWDTRSIGPYKVHLDLQFVEDDRYIPTTKSDLLYQLLLNYDALAVFDFNKVSYGFIKDGVFQTYVYSKQNDRLKSLYYEDVTIDGVRPWVSIGYVRTFLPNFKMHTIYPYSMVQDPDTGLIPGFGEFSTKMAMPNPPATLYRELLKTDHAGVYIDATTNQPCFLDYRPEYAVQYMKDTFMRDPLHDYYT